MSPMKRAERAQRSAVRAGYLRLAATITGDRAEATKQRKDQAKAMRLTEKGRTK